MSYDSTIGILPFDISLGGQIGADFLTSVVRTPNGYEYRDILRAGELGSWVVSYDATKGSKRRELAAFHRAARGRGYSFRARDPLDYTVSSAEGVFAATTVATEWQMMKRYTTVGGAIYDRKITKLGPNATASAGAIDFDTGIVTNATMPASWQTDLFYVQLRFDSDQFMPRIVTRNGSHGELIVSHEFDLVEVDEPAVEAS